MKVRHIIFIFFILFSLCGIACLYLFPSEIYKKESHIRNIISENFDPCDHWIAADRPTLIYKKPPSHWIGETESMTSLLKTAHKMGWNVIPVKKAMKLSKEQLKNAFGLFIHNPLIWDPQIKEIVFPNDIPLVMLNNFVETNYCANPNKYLDKLVAMKYGNNIQKLSGILAVTNKEVELPIEQNNVLPNLKFIMNWYLTTGTTYHQPKLNKLMYCGANWGDVRMKSEKYKKLWNQLDEMDYFAIYGSLHWQRFQAYKSFIPADGESFVKEINKNGICLVLHSEIHLKEGIPSGRIFEAAAAAAVIISDRHSFVEREFKDSVLYIDVARDDLFEQIDSHMQWIKSHPAEAMKKARLAHAIFLQKFRQEQQLAKLYEKLFQIKQ